MQTQKSDADNIKNVFLYKDGGKLLLELHLREFDASIEDTRM
jgi:hypothetical protein